MQELAVFEKMPNAVKMSKEQLAKDVERNAVYGLIAENGEGEPAGMVLFYMAYSTWVGQVRSRMRG